MLAFRRDADVPAERIMASWSSRHRTQDHHDQIATSVGSTRQWVTITVDKFQKKETLSAARQSIVMERYDLLMAQTTSE